MNTALATPLKAARTDEKIILQNDSKWESSHPKAHENGQIVEVAFDGANPRKRESSAKPPRRVTNAERRSREFLTESEVNKLLAAAEKVGRHGHRDATLLLMAYRHALRVSARHQQIQSFEIFCEPRSRGRGHRSKGDGHKRA